MFKIQYGLTGRYLESLSIFVSGQCVLHFKEIWQTLSEGSQNNSSITICRGPYLWLFDYRNGVSKVKFLEHYEPIIEIHYVFVEDNFKIFTSKNNLTLENNSIFQEINNEVIRSSFELETAIDVFGKSTNYIEASFNIGADLMDKLNQFANN